MILLHGLPLEEITPILLTVNETESKLQHYLELIKQWIKCQPHFPHDTYDDAILDKFLRGCKLDLERAKRKLDMYYTARTLYPNIFSLRDPCSASTIKSLQNFNVVPLPKTTPNGCRITVHRFTSNDVSKYEPLDTYRSIFMIGDIRLREEPPIVGDIFIFDMDNVTAAHLAKMANPMLPRIMNCTQNAYPQRLSEIHILHAPSMAEKVVALFRMFMKEKLRNRFHIHTKHDTLINHIPASHLPEDYGGELESISKLQSLWIKKLESYKNYFEAQAEVRTDESKRIEKQLYLDPGDVFGFDGSFRQLNID